MIWKLLGFAVVCWLVLDDVEAKAELRAVGLRCEYLESPLGIDERQPRLSWRVESAERGERQTAYEIVVAETRDRLEKGQEILWDSGKVANDETVNVPYRGKSLTSGQSCF